MDKKIFFKGVEFEKAQYNDKWVKSDTRRIIFFVKFNDGSIWYPKDEEIKLLSNSREICFQHNIKFPNIDKDDNRI